MRPRCIIKVNIGLKVLAWCHKATNYHQSQCWSRLMSPYGITRPHWVNTWRPRQHGRHFADDTFKHTFLNENVRIPIKNSLKFVRKGPINNIPALAQIMAWRQSGDMQLPEPMVAKLPTHICVTRPQWINSQKTSYISPSQAKDKVEYSVLKHGQFSPKYSQETPPWLSSKGKLWGVMLYFAYIIVLDRFI